MLIINAPSRSANVVPPPSFKACGRIVVTSVLPNHRDIPLSYGAHVRGHHPVFEGHGSIKFESLVERDAISMLARFSELVRIESQPVTIFYEEDGEAHRYTPDLRVTLSKVPFELECLGFRKSTLVECKPAGLVAHHKANLERAFRAARLAFGRIPVLLTDEDVFGICPGVRHGD